MIVYRGDILTCTPDFKVSRYLAEEGGRIAFVGDTLPAEYAHIPITDLGQKALVPAFADTHLHFASMALFYSGLNLMDVRSNAELKEKFSAFLPTSKAKVVIAFGASPHSVAERKLLSRADLDEVAPDRPATVIKYDGHALIANTKLLEALPPEVAARRGYDADSGELNQEAFFAATDYISSTVAIPDLVQSMQRAMDYMASKGIGLMHSVSGVGFPKDLDVDMERYIGRGASGGFQTRIFFQTMDTDKVMKRKLPRIGGCFATALDGCFGSMDAALSEPYEGTANRGVLYYSDEEVTDFCKRANRLGLQIELHAIGDAAFRQATNALKAALDDFPRKDHRHGIIHACLPTAEGIDICAEYGIQLPVQTSFIVWPQEPDWYLRDILGEREARLNPLRTFADKGIRLSFGSDSPCTDPDPMLWIHNAVNHPVRTEALTVQEALRMATYNGYWTSFDEKERGSLETGKIADMVILSANPYTSPPTSLKDIRPEQLILGGVPYPGQKQSIFAHIVRGLLSKEKI
ncbi:MAG: amidohydrolase [Oscillospiraceae bacterium]|nr:amidohydrolase [Oscillospiraceae bacterium]